MRPLGLLATTAAFALLLGAIASWFGGRLGTVNPTITELTTRVRR